MNYPLLWPTVEEASQTRLHELHEACDACEALLDDDHANPADVVIALHRVMEAFDRLPGPVIEELS